MTGDRPIPEGDNRNGPGGSDPDRPHDDGPPLDEEVRRAVAEVRREGLKAAVLVAVVEGTAAALLVNLAVALATVPELSAGVLGPVTLGHVAAAGVGVTVAGGEFGWRRRRSTVERFESANPRVREALRTARDAAGADRDDAVARTLYERVLADLRETSSAELVPWRRLAAGVVVVAVAGALTVGVAATGAGTPTPAVDPGPTTTTATGGAVDDGTDPGETELRSGEEVLGNETNVSSGDRNLTATIDPGAGGQGDREFDDRQGYEPDGDRPDVEARRAGYASADPPEDAELIGEYTIALQESEDEDEERGGDDEGEEPTANESREDDERGNGDRSRDDRRDAGIRRDAVGPAGAGSGSATTRPDLPATTRPDLSTTTGQTTDDHHDHPTDGR